MDINTDKEFIQYLDFQNELGIFGRTNEDVDSSFTYRDEQIIESRLNSMLYEANVIYRKNSIMLVLASPMSKLQIGYWIYHYLLPMYFEVFVYDGKTDMFIRKYRFKGELQSYLIENDWMYFKVLNSGYVKKEIDFFDDFGTSLNARNNESDYELITDSQLIRAYLDKNLQQRIDNIGKNFYYDSSPPIYYGLWSERVFQASEKKSVIYLVAKENMINKHKKVVGIIKILPNSSKKEVVIPYDLLKSTFKEPYLKSKGDMSRFFVIRVEKGYDKSIDILP